MTPRSYLLAAGAVAVVVGGVYLWRDAQGSKAVTPSAAAVAAAEARHAQARGAADAERARRPGRVVEPDPALAFPAGAGVLRPRADLPGADPERYTPPSGDRVRVDGAMQPAIDPDDPEAASAMTESNKAYDRGDYEGARQMALKMLNKDPSNVRMIRVVVSSSCIMGEVDVAAKYWAQLPKIDQAQMSIRCARYQVSFPTGEPTPPPSEK